MKWPFWRRISRSADLWFVLVHLKWLEVGRESSCCRRILGALLLSGLMVTAATLDVVIVDKPLSPDDRRNEYTDKL